MSCWKQLIHTLTYAAMGFGSKGEVWRNEPPGNGGTVRTPVCGSPFGLSKVRIVVIHSRRLHKFSKIAFKTASQCELMQAER